jgi:hypothetical protein
VELNGAMERIYLAGVAIDSHGMRITNADGIETFRYDRPPEPAVHPAPRRVQPPALTVGELIAELGKFDPATKVTVSIDRDYDEYSGDLTRLEDDGYAIDLIAGD